MLDAGAGAGAERSLQFSSFYDARRWRGWNKVYSFSDSGWVEFNTEAQRRGRELEQSLQFQNGGNAFFGSIRHDLVRFVAIEGADEMHGRARERWLAGG
jgi:hypothetical protein